jgi:outer membrane receptor protein involved in Fe transport
MMNVQLRQRLLATTLLFGAGAFASPAFAQATPPSSSPEAAQAAVEEAVSDVPQTDIVVTGSRIRRPDLEGSSPTAVVSAEEFSIQAGAANVENILNDLPQVTATQTATSNNPGGGTATVNLRNLGSQRTLVMVDGRRYMSFDVTQVVDLNTIPGALIDRVDIVTGGQSAVYGSDAIAGVVNFIMKRNFTGVQLDSSVTMTQKGDGQIFDTSLTLGTNFADNRGNVTVFGGYTKRQPTFAGERDFSFFALNDTVDANGSPILQPGGSGSTPRGRINIAGLGTASGLGCNNQTFNPDGTATCFTSTTAYNFNPVNYLQVPQERFMTALMGEYEINDHFVPYIEGQFANNRVLAQLAGTPISNGSPFAGNTSGTVGPLNLLVNSPFFAPSVRASLAALDTDGNGYVSAPSFGFRTITVPRINKDERNAFRLLAGMKGDLFAGFDYDGYYMYSRTKNSQRQLGNIRIDNFLAAASNNVFFNSLTGATRTTPAAGFELACGTAAQRAAGCVPANLFGEGNISSEAEDFIGLAATNLEEYATQVASVAFTNNDLFDLGAGGIGVAFGAEWRKEAGAIEPDTFLASGNVAGFNPGEPTAGSYTVREFFAETRVPLLKDNFIHKLELNGAVRSSTYSNAPGNVVSYNAGAEFGPTRDLTFRGQYAKTVRGPSVNELFLGNTVSFNGNNDQCGTPAAIPAGPLRNICLAQGVPAASVGNPAIQDPNSINPLTFLGGNEDLVEESAKTLTLGVVLTPTFLPRFSATVDFYKIKIDGFITTVGTDTIGTLCFENFNQAYCDLITRNSLGEVETITDTLSNSGGLKTSGIDVSAGYYHPLGRFLWADSGRLGFSFSGSRLLKSDTIPVVGLDTVIKCVGRFGNQCGVPTPKWRHTLRTTLGLGAVRLSGQWRYIGKSRDDDDASDYAVENIKAFNYFDATTTFDVGDHYEMNVGVSNIFDKKPPIGATAQSGGSFEQSNTFPTMYDVLGRSFFVSGKLKF